MRRASVFVCIVSLTACPVDPVPDEVEATGTTAHASTGSSGSSAMAEPDSTGEMPMSGDSSSTAAPADTSTGAQMLCEGGLACLDRAPLGWLGPVAVELGSTQRDPCTGMFDQLELTAQAQLVAPPPSCECSCDMQGAYQCASSVAVTTYDAGQCAGAGVQHFLDDVCDAGFSLSAGASFRVADVAASGVTCQATTIADIPDATFTEHTELCGMSQPIACGEGGACADLEALQGASLCVYASGDLVCPDGWTDERVLGHGGFDDQRGCAECTCTPFEGTCSGFSVHLHATNSCNQPVGTGVPGGSCQTLGSSGATAAIVDGSPQGLDGDCVGHQSAPAMIGQITEIDPITVCCAAAPPVQ